MNATLKKALIGIGIAIGVVALIFGGLTIYRNVSRKPVEVYPAMMLGTTGGYDYSKTSYGTVSKIGRAHV